VRCLDQRAPFHRSASVKVSSGAVPYENESVPRYSPTATQVLLDGQEMPPRGNRFVPLGLTIRSRDQRRPFQRAATAVLPLFSRNPIAVQAVADQHETWLKSSPNAMR
jgi:hypothetical protein